jgi:GTPase involved in cell partitioning and DNA repair
MDGRDPVSDLQILTDELAAYGDGNMLNRRSLVVANKMDLLNKNDREEIIDGLVSVVEEAGIRMEGDIIGISAGVTGEGLPTLSNAMRDIVSLSEADKERQNAMVLRSMQDTVTMSPHLKTDKRPLEMSGQYLRSFSVK